MFGSYLLSVIVPIYNSEKYITKCLECLLGQSLSPIEIIIVNDGSTDQTKMIAQRYANKYRNVVLINNTTPCGCGPARNIGLKSASADIVGFFDVDDYADQDYFKNMYTALQKFRADIACSDLALVYNKEILYSNLLEDNPYLHENNISISTRNPELPQIISPETASAHWGAAAAPTKLFLKSKSIPFGEGISDDIPRTFPLLAQAEKIVYVPNNYYYYVQRDTSLEHSPISIKKLGLGSTLIETLHRLPASASGKEIAKLIFAFSSWRILLNILALNSSEDKKAFLSTYFKNLCADTEPIQRLLQSNQYLEHLLAQKSFGERTFIHDLIRLFLEKDFNQMIGLYEKFGEVPQNYLPKVSIIIPVYNGSNFLQEAICSALAQDYPNLEVIIVNDGSNDHGETEQIALSFGERIKYYYKPNGGVASALNYGIEKMTGEYFSWLSHDDKYEPDKISKSIYELAKFQDPTTPVVCGYKVINSENNILYDVNPLSQYTKEELQRPLFAVVHGCIHGCAILIHKKLFESNGVFNPELPTTQDYDLWFRLLRNKEICFLDGSYVLSRCHEKQDSKRYYKQHLKECNSLWIKILSSLSQNEMEEMVDKNELYKVRAFWLSEKAFFTQTPYNEVISFINSKLLEEAKNIWITTGKGYYLSQISGLDKNILSLSIFKQYITDLSKERICIITNQFNEIEIDNLFQDIASNTQNKFQFFKIILGNTSKMRLLTFGSIVEMHLPDESSTTLALILRLLKIQKCIFSGELDSKISFNFEEFKSLGLQLIIYCTKSLFDYYSENTVLSQINRKKMLENADLIIWQDDQSGGYPQYRDKSITIPPNYNLEATNFWIQIFENTVVTNIKLINPTDAEDIWFVLYERLLSQYVNNSNEISIAFSKEQTASSSPIVNESKWQEAYESIYNSTSWKATFIFRRFVDYFKEVLNKKR